MKLVSNRRPDFQFSLFAEEFHEFAVSHPEYGALFAHQEIESKSASSESDQGHEIKV